MKIWRFVALTLLVVVLAFVVEAARDDAAKPSQRTWTDRRGKTLEATFEKMLSGTVYLKTAAGKPIRISLTQLSADDQKLARELAKTTAKTAKPRFASRGPRKVMTGILSDEEVKELKTQWVCEKTGKKMLFFASFSTRSLNSKDKRKYSKSGKTPYRITATLYEVKKKKGKEFSVRQKGTARLYVLDSEGTVVENKTASLSKLCPS